MSLSNSLALIFSANKLISLDMTTALQAVALGTFVIGAAEQERDLGQC
jgi:hypothetical protein